MSNTACSLGTAHAQRDTGKALLVECEDLGDTIWVPHSCIHDDSEVFDADNNADGELVVLEWWARKEGLA